MTLGTEVVVVVGGGGDTFAVAGLFLRFFTVGGSKSALNTIGLLVVFAIGVGGCSSFLGVVDSVGTADVVVMVAMLSVVTLVGDFSVVVGFSVVVVSWSSVVAVGRSSVVVGADVVVVGCF